MAISLSKGGNVSLNSASPGLTDVIVGLGWDPRQTTGNSFDLDATIFITNSSGKVINDEYFVFFNNTKSPCGHVVHTGDNRSGAGDGDDEQISVNLAALSSEVQKIIFAVTIHEGEKLNQNFGQVSNAYIRILNRANQVEIARYDLSEDSSMETAMMFGELYRHNNEWKFRAVGQGFQGGLASLARHFGVNV